MTTSSQNQLMTDLLTWLDIAPPRTYGDVMAVWRSSCPRMTVWEDAVAAGLVEVARRTAAGRCAVTLTARGRAMCAAARKT